MLFTKSTFYSSSRTCKEVDSSLLLMQMFSRSPEVRKITDLPTFITGIYQITTNTISSFLNGTCVFWDVGFYAFTAKLSAILMIMSYKPYFYCYYIMSAAVKTSLWLLAQLV